MGNKEKRLRRAKEKAKRMRLARQSKSAREESDDDIVEVSQQIVNFFKTLPAPSPNYDGLPEIMEYVQNTKNEAFDDDFEASVTSLYVLYGHWFTSGSNMLAWSELAAMAMLLSKKPEFRAKLNERYFALEGGGLK